MICPDTGMPNFAPEAVLRVAPRSATGLGAGAAGVTALPLTAAGAAVVAPAATLGAGEWQRFSGIVLPSLRQSMLSGLVMVAALSIGEFNLSNLLVGFQNRTYPVVLLQAANAYPSAADNTSLLPDRDKAAYRQSTPEFRAR